METDFAVPAPDSLTMLMVFDGEWQWIETHTQQNGKRGVTVQKVSMTAADRPGRYFDTGYYAHGMGLDESCDYRATVLSLLDVYQFKLSSNTQNDHTQTRQLQGLIDEDGYLKQNPTFKDVPTAERDQVLFDPVRHCEVWLSSEGLVREINVPGVATDVKFQALEVNPAIPPQMFIYHPPKGVPVTDITKQVLDSKRNSEQ
jgi:hypothetical protein